MIASTLLTALLAAGAAEQTEAGISLQGSFHQTRGARLLGGLELDASWRPSSSEPLRLTDGLRLERSASPLPLDTGSGLSSDLRQILALVLGFVPGFGLGHLIAGDKDGFILFLIIDVALYVLWWGVGWTLFHPFKVIGGVVWLVVHIIQALDAYASAGGPRIVQAVRERAVQLADLGPGRDSAPATFRVFAHPF